MGSGVKTMEPEATGVEAGVTVEPEARRMTSQFREELNRYRVDHPLFGLRDPVTHQRLAPTVVQLWYAETAEAVTLQVDEELEGLVWGEHALAHLAGQGLAGTGLFAEPGTFVERPTAPERIPAGAFVWKLTVPRGAAAPVWNAIAPRVPLKVELYYEERPEGERTVTVLPQAHHVEGVIWGENFLEGLAQRGIAVTFVDQLAYATANSAAQTCLLVNDGVVCG